MEVEKISNIGAFRGDLEGFYKGSGLVRVLGDCHSV